VPLLAVDDHATGDRPEQRQARVGDVTAGGLEDDVEFAPHGGPHVVHPVRAGVVDTEIGAEPAGEVQLGRRAGGRDDLLAHLLAPRTADLQAHLAAAGLDLDRRARAVADLVDAVLRRGAALPRPRRVVVCRTFVQDRCRHGPVGTDVPSETTERPSRQTR
jgi:hypothetical protein